MLTTMIPQLLRAEPELAPVLHDRKAVHDLLGKVVNVLMNFRVSDSFLEDRVHDSSGVGCG